MKISIFSDSSTVLDKSKILLHHPKQSNPVHIFLRESSIKNPEGAIRVIPNGLNPNSKLHLNNKTI